MGRKKNRFKRGVFILIVFVVVFQCGRPLFMQEEWKARNYVYDRIKLAFPIANNQVQAGYKIHAYADQDISANILPKPIVVLVHGLDEPGRVWLNLAPILDERDYHVLFMSYPNDQEITASARLFFDGLKARNVNPGNHLVIIGHSMGGLVARQMLTDPKINYNKVAAAEQVPKVSDLIMVGTPNHGAQLARFRFVMEIREQVQNLFEPGAHWLTGVLDGTGAAGIDLIPGSSFLTKLNSRPHPPGVNFHVIAGILMAWGEKGEGGKGLGAGLTTITKIVGDGLVTVESARLDHIPLTRVEGSHLTMIRNLTQGSKRMPPAIPIILDILDRG